MTSKKLGIMVILLCLLWPHTNHAQSEEDLFEQIFKTKPKPFVSRPLTVRLFFRDKEQGEITLQTTKEADVFLVPKVKFLILYAGLLIPEEIDTIQNRYADTISTKELQERNYKISYNSRRLFLEITPPPSQLCTIKESILPPIINQSEDAISPKGFSGFANIKPTILTRYDKQPTLALTLDNTLFWEGWVLKGNFIKSGDYLFSFNGASAYYDFEKSLDRLTLGYTPYSGDTAGGSGNSLGIQWNRNWGLNPDLLAEAGYKTKLFLEQPSSVTVLVNGIMVKQSDMEAGKYELTQFPLTNGPCKIEVVASSNGQSKTLVSDTYIYDGSLLRTGLMDFSINAGYKQPDFSEVSLKTPQLTLSNKIGITDQFTLGAFSQFEQKNSFGLNYALGTPLCLIGGQTQVSMPKDSPSGYYSQLKIWTYSNPYKAYNDALLFQIGFWDPNFSETSSPQWMDISGSLSLASFPGTSFSGFTRLYYDKQQNTAGYSISTPLSFWNREWRCNIAHSYSATTGQKIDFEFSTTFGIKELSLNTTVREMVGKSTQVNTTYQAPGSTDKVAVNTSYESAQSYSVRSSWEKTGINNQVNYTQTDDKNSLQYSGVLNDPRYISRVSTTFNNAGQTQSRFSFETAICFADGQWAISRPINNNFLILYLHPALKGSEIKFQKATIDGFGPAVIPDLPPYKSVRLFMKEAKIPFGADTGNKTWSIFQKNGSGTAVQIGKPGSLALLGTLIYQDKPLGLMGAEVVDKETKEQIAIIFTNKKGQFQFLGALPGKTYQIRFGSDELSDLDIETASNALEQIDLGVLPVQDKSKENEDHATIVIPIAPTQNALTKPKPSIQQGD